MIPYHDLAAFGQVLLVDLVLAGDNAVVVGLVVAGLPRERRRGAILLGIGAAAGLRILLGAVALHLLEIIGLLLAGGLLLLWVAWKMYRELRGASAEVSAPVAKTLRAAVWQILLADLSMSLDNVLAVAGAADGRIWVLVAGLAVSVVLMGAAASLIARMLSRFRWLGWVGLLVVLEIALRLIWDGAWQVAERLG